MKVLSLNFFKKYSNFCIISSLVLASLIIRTINLKSVPVFDYDEGQILNLSRQIFKGALLYKDYIFDHMPEMLYFYGFLDHLKIPLEGIRFASIFISSLTIIFIYLLAFRLTNKKWLGGLASVVFIFDPLLLFRGQFAILDPILAFFTTIFVYLFLYSKSKIGHIAAGLMLGIAFWIKVTALYFFILPLIAFFFEKKLDKKYFLTLVGFLLPFLIFGFLFFNKAVFEQLFLSHLIRETMALNERLFNLNIFLPYILLYVFTLFLGFLLIFKKDLSSKLRTITFFTVISFPLLFFLPKTFYEQHFFYLTPFMGIVFSVVITKFKKISLLSGLALLVFSIVISLTQYKYLKSGLKLEYDAEKDVILTLKPLKGNLYSELGGFNFATNKNPVNWKYGISTFLGHEKKFKDGVYIENISKADNILVEGRFLMYSESIKSFLGEKYTLVFDNGAYKILTKNN